MNAPTQLAVLTVLMRLMKDQHAHVKDATGDEMDPGDRKTAMLGEHKIASVSMTEPSTKAKVVDEAAFLAWVQDNYPSEIAPVVRESYRKKILDEAKGCGAPVTANGEFLPGVEVTEGRSYPTVRLTSDAHEAIADAWQAGAVPDLGALLAIERSTDADTG